MSEGKKFLGLNDRILTWAEAKGIFQANSPVAQLGKTLEECVELLKAINNGDAEQIKCELGDVLVTVCIRTEMSWRFYTTAFPKYNEPKPWTGAYVAALDSPAMKYSETHLGLLIRSGVLLEESVLLYARDIAAYFGFTACEALEAAVCKIESRKGRMINGVFVKESDLPTE